MADALKGDRRWTAILSTDMANFTAISQSLGPEQTFRLLNDVLAIAKTSIERHGGHIIDTAGDGILAAFGAPKALENASLQSCRAATEFHTKIAEASTELEERFGFQPQFRTGIGGGNTLVAHGPEGSIKVVGDPVNKASRLQGMAEPGEIIISETIRRETGVALTTTSRGEVFIKGFALPVAVHSLDGLALMGPSAGTAGELVSRSEEVATALQLLGSGQPMTLMVSGVAGIGKSHVLAEIRASLLPERKSYLGQCATNGQTRTYGPIFDILREAGGAPWDADRAAIFESLFTAHPDLPKDPDSVSVLADVGSLRDQSERALNARAYLRTLLTALHEREKAVFIIEDVHWIDTASNALLSMMSDAPLTLLVTSRPGFNADWLDVSASGRLTLEPLSAADMRTIAEKSLGAILDDTLAALIAEKAEGVPFIAEEVARALKQSGRLAPTDAGLTLDAAADKGQASLLTGNLEQLILSRVDNLEPQDRETLRIASAIGREFSEKLLSAASMVQIHPKRIAETPGLIELVADGQWRFAHALIRDAVYDSLVTTHRQSTHLKIADAMQLAMRPGDDWSILADHYLKSDAPERAAPFLIRAGGQSLAAYALKDVDGHLDQALKLISVDPDIVDDKAFANLGAFWLRAMHQAGDFNRLLSVSADVLPRMARSGYSSELGVAKTLTAIAYGYIRDYERGEALALETLREAEIAEDDWGAAWAKVALMRIYDETRSQGIPRIEALADEIAPVAKKERDHHLGMYALYMLSSAYRGAGRRLDALAVAEEIEAFSSRYNDRRARSFALWAKALVYSVEGNPELAYAEIKKAQLDVIPGSGDERVVRGLEYFCRMFFEPPEKLRGRVHALMEEARSLRDYNICHGTQWMLAILELKAGNLAKGWQALLDYQRETQAAGNVHLIAQGYVSQSEALLALAGLIDPEAEASADRPSFPKARPGLFDIWTFAKLRLSGRRLATDALEACLALPGQPHQARCKINLGLLAAASGDVAKAREFLAAGYATVSEQELTLLANRAQRGLSRLGSD